MSETPTSNISPRVIEDEMKEAYMAYAMSVIVGRALPHVRDGLKPVHRRILYAMQDMGMKHNTPYKKSARIVGEVLGKYHPHGDTAIYDSLVRMAQNFSLRYPLIQGQGNFGNIDGDNAAAMRYTEARLHKISENLLQDLEKETVDWTNNFDGSLKEPEVLPALLPNLLINGSSGIAVGMATNMPPHNIKETINAIHAFIDDPSIGIQELIDIVPGPDFPTGGKICGKNGIISAYTTGKGRLIIQGEIRREERGDKTSLIITEIPYQVVKSDLIEQIADNVRNKRIEGIRDIRDESDRQGMRIVLELRNNANPDIIENNLFKHTRLQTTFGVINLAIVDNEPKILSLKGLIQHYVDHRIEVVTRRTTYDLRKAEERAHILEGLLIALKNIDAVVEKIKKSNNAEEARKNLITTYELTTIQANAILEMRLSRLTALETKNIKEEHTQLLTLIEELKDILAKPQRIKNIIKKELETISERYGDERKTEIIDVHEEIDLEDLIDPEEMVVTISHQGYAKRLPLDTYRAQGRGGVGIRGATTKEDDFVETLFVANTHNYILFFSNKGEVYWKKVYCMPEAGRNAKGTPLVNLIELDKQEKISAVIPVKEFSEEQYLVFATKKGYIKKTPLSAYGRPRQGGIHAIKLDDDDDLVRVVLTNGNSTILLATAKGQAIHFHEKDVRPMGRYVRGVTGMKLRGKDEVVSLNAAEEGKTVLTITENGYGKKTPLNDYRVQGRGGYGVINIKTTNRNGHVSSVRVVDENDDLLLISQKGIIIRTPTQGISTMGRNTQGVRIMKLRPGDKLSSIAKVTE